MPIRSNIWCYLHEKLNEVFSTKTISPFVLMQCFFKISLKKFLLQVYYSFYKLISFLLLSGCITHPTCFQLVFFYLKLIWNQQSECQQKAQNSHICVYHFFLYLAVNVEQWEQIVVFLTTLFVFSLQHYPLKRNARRGSISFFVCLTTFTTLSEDKNRQHNIDPEVTVKTIA